MYVKATKREPYLLWLVAGLPLVGVYFLAPGSVQDLTSPTLALAASLIILLRSLRFEGALRVAWILIGAGFLQSAIGDGLWTLYEVVWEIEPFPSYADLFYVAFYPLITAGLVTLVRWHRAGDRDSLVDAAIVAIGAGVLTWVFIMSPYVFDSSMTLVERLVSLAYPVGDLLLLAVLVRLVFAPGKFSISTGVACLAWDESAAELLARADQALYASKDARAKNESHPARSSVTARVRPSPAL